MYARKFISTLKKRRKGTKNLKHMQAYDDKIPENFHFINQTKQNHKKKHPHADASNVVFLQYNDYNVTPFLKIAISW